MQQQVAVVTGASRGIGKSIAAELVSRGYDVMLIARQSAQLSETQAELTERASGSVVAFPGDVGSWDSMQSVVDRVRSVYGRIDALVNAAGVNIRKDIRETTLAEWNEVLRTNLTGAFITCKLVSEIMVAQESGSIVNISSVQARLGGTSPQYSASKAGLHGLTFALARS